MTKPKSNAQMLSENLSKSIEQLRRASIRAAKSEHRYRMKKAIAYVSAGKGTVAQKEAEIYKTIGKYRYVRDKYEMLRIVELENVRSLRQQISLLQSLAKAGSLEHDSIMNGQME